MATTTPNLGLLKPVVGASADEWGGDLNASIDTLDAKVLDKTTGGTVNGPISVTNLSYSGSLTGGTGVINIGSGQVYKDAAGNVGIGTSAPAARLHVSGGSSTELRLTSSGDITTGAASLIRFGGSNNALSGYAGFGGTATTFDVVNALNGPIAFYTNNIERGRFTSVGNLLVGTTVDRGHRIYAEGDTAQSATIRVRNAGSDTTEFASVQLQSGGGVFRLQSIPGQAGQGIAFVQDGVAERARITSGGNLLVGTTVDGGKKIDARGLNTQTIRVVSDNGGIAEFDATSSGGFSWKFQGTSDSMRFVQDAIERARITSAGFAKFSNTGSYGGVAGLADLSGGQNHVCQSNASGNTTLAVISSNTGQTENVGSYSPAASGANHFSGYINNSRVYQVLANGNVQNASGAAISPISSDARIKQVTDTLDDALDVITKLRPVKFDYMGKHESFGKNIYGFIAQEVGQAKPDAVMDSGLKDDDIPDLKTYDASFIVPYLVKALQQSNARVEQLESRIAALEAK